MVLCGGIAVVAVVVGPGVAMKFSCEQCQTRYSIGDEKVRGKVLKIRCKTCGNIVVVREQMATAVVEHAGAAVGAAVGAGQLASTGTNSVAAADVAEAAAVDAPPPAPQSGGIEWFIAIKGKQHGPASADEVARLYREGQISERSYLWHEKLPAWTRLKELPEFTSLVAEGPAPARRLPSPPPPPEEGAEIVNLEAARAQRQQREGASPAPHDPFASVAAGPETQPGMRDSTRVFLQKAGLHNRGTKHKLYAAIAAVSACAFVALIIVDYQLDILGLRQVVDAVAEKTGIIEAPQDEGPGWDDVDADPTLKCQLMPDPAACIKKAKAKAARVAGAKRPSSTPTALAGASVGGDDLKDAFGAGTDSGSGGRPVGVSVGQDGFMNVGAGSPSQDAVDRMLKGKGGPSGPKARIELPATIGAGIDAENAKKVVQDGQGAIQVCVDNAMKMNEDIPSKVIFTLSIGKKGNVEKAAAGSAVVGASSLGSCLSGAMRKWKFAPPSEPTDLDIPLILR